MVVATSGLSPNIYQFVMSCRFIKIQSEFRSRRKVLSLGGLLQESTKQIKHRKFCPRRLAPAGQASGARAYPETNVKRKVTGTARPVIIGDNRAE